VKTSLSHLPARKQEELRAITGLICAAAPVGMLVLFGSHARGDWVEDPEGGYFSDYDLLAIVQSRAVADDAALWSRLEQQANELAGKSAVSLIAHDIKHVNSEIRAGSYFFSDIRNEGVVLFDAKTFTLASPKEASPAERLERAERNFEYWFGSAGGFLRGAQFYIGEGLNNHAAFSLHQTAERLFTTVAMVFTGYKVKVHDLQKLHAGIAPLHPDLRDVLPRSTPEDAHLFDLLRRAYIDARYVKSYRITAEELAAIGEHVRAFMAVVERVCREKIASLRAAAEAAS
jgi:HEPN domain-containing protein/predicted nucleotidyltransferase